MKDPSQFVKRLKNHGNVDAVFLTGSRAKKNATTSSDLDIVVVLKKNVKSLRSLYTWIDGTFSDIFFFDRADLKRMHDAKKLNANDLDAIFISWLRDAEIFFDKTGTITTMQTDAALQQKMEVPHAEQWEIWRKICYNVVANTRYFSSKDSLYKEALEIRLLYSVVEFITGYFMLRNIPWRGEKFAVSYFKEHEPKFHVLFQKFVNARDVHTRFRCYKKMVELVLPNGYTLWSEQNTIVVGKNPTVNQEDLIQYWQELMKAE